MPAPSRQASRGSPFGAQQSGADANRNAWMAGIDSRRPRETSRRACSALLESLLNARFFSFVLTNATQSQRLLRLNYKQSVCLGHWPLGCLPRLSGRPDFNTNRAKEQENSSRTGLEAGEGSDLSCEAEELSLPKAF